MRLIRIFQEMSLSVGQTVALDSQSASHLTKVLRLTVGDAIVLFNGDGGEYHGRIDQISKRSTAVLLDEFIEHSVESNLQIELGQCVSRGDRMDYAIQKSVELGVASIYPLNSLHSGVHIPAERMEKRRLHWQRVAISACEQCGRNKVPTIEAITHLNSWLSSRESAKKLLLDPNADLTAKQIELTGKDKISLLIGPEGGLSNEEIEQAVGLGFTAIRLGPRVLRTETAAVAALTSLQTLWGDLA